MRRPVFFSTLFCVAALFWMVSAAPAAAAGPAGEASVEGAPALEEDPFLDSELDTLYEEADIGDVLVPDPLEPLNRAFFQFNDRLYFWVLKPVGTGYRTVVPTEIRTCVKNFFYNLFAPIRITNALLQGKGGRVKSETLRFTLNSLAGLGGLADVTAERFPELKTYDEDLGQTMAVYGIGNGFYIVVPFMGPATLRDATGWIGDRFLSPVTWTVDSLAGGIGIYAFRSVNDLSFRIGDYETLKAASLDPYAAFRDGYIQFRNNKIRE